VARQRGSFRGRVSVPKGRAWEETPGGGASTAVSVAGTGILGAGRTPTVSEVTILRTRGRFMIQLADPNAAGDEMRLTAGIGIVSSDAFAAGAGSMPDPLTDIAYPWMWWDTWFLKPGSATVGNPQPQSSVQSNMVVDVKAMRKVGIDQTIALIFEVTDVVGTPVANIAFDGRLLLQWAGS